ncbi:class I mannose-6-phosphate isomerase [Halolactibacillus sp. JCM 19043]|uniref:class I mannose-6-phosphate isomerase n=1 Tax=Halolactibacillus sp. JCM 19043 TaxID=1460638 RepID=UPI000A675797|nr:class I mannose-6-phosphate isomerase [Halolactibacillus sp. JCM 19043]
MNYNCRPSVNIKNQITAYINYTAIVQQLKQEITHKRINVITIENYPIVDEQEIKNSLINKLQPDLIIHTDEILIEQMQIDEMIAHNLTDDRIFGVMSHHALSDFINQDKHQAVQEKINAVIASNGLVVVYGVGASLVTISDLLVYADLSRWEIQQRYRSGAFSNWRANNAGEDPNRMLKRGYFFEWRVADKQKKYVLPKSAYVLDTHHKGVPVMIRTDDYLAGLKEVSKQPFSLVPFFDSGVWGGHWMQDTFNLERDKVNLAWSFNGVPEENSLLLNFNGIEFESPGSNLLFFYGEDILGSRVFGKFGEEFPIRFNFLDTVGGQNLSLQVHPKLSYLQDTFGSHYTQDESYYILHADRDDAHVYLGFNKGVEKQELMSALRRAESGDEVFDDKKYIYQHKIKKHDHYLIPAGTIHSSGADCVVLEISSTPNRFTFKLWDWGRVDLDGKPRTVHLYHGEPNLDMRRDEDWVKKELVNQFIVVDEGEVDRRKNRFT